MFTKTLNTIDLVQFSDGYFEFAHLAGKPENLAQAFNPAGETWIEVGAVDDIS
jgi:hypothetical protein